MMTEYDNGERVTAVMTSHTDSGENYEGAITIGVYPENDQEIWVAFGNGRMNVQLADVPAFCKQLKRAAVIAATQKS